MRRGRIALVCGAATLWWVACVYDAERRCDSNQAEIDDDRCVCQEGYIAEAGGCVPCGENQVARGGAGRAAASSVCWKSGVTEPVSPHALSPR